MWGLACWRDFLCFFTFISFQLGLNAPDRDAVSLCTSLSFLSLDSCGLFLGGRLALCVWFSEMSPLPVPTVVASQTWCLRGSCMRIFCPSSHSNRSFFCVCRMLGLSRFSALLSVDYEESEKCNGWFVFFIFLFYLEGCLQISCAAPCPVSLVIILWERGTGCRVLFWVAFQESTLSCSPHRAFKNSLIVQLFFSYLFVRPPPISPYSGKNKTLWLSDVWTGFYNLWNSV